MRPECATKWALGEISNAELIKQTGATVEDRRKIFKLGKRNGVKMTSRDTQALLAFSEFLKIAGPPPLPQIGGGK